MRKGDLVVLEVEVFRVSLISAKLKAGAPWSEGQIDENA